MDQAPHPHNAKHLIVGLVVSFLCAATVYVLVSQLAGPSDPQKSPERKIEADAARLQEAATLGAVIDYASRYGYEEIILRPEASPTFYQFGVDEGPGIVPTLQDPETSKDLPFPLFSSISTKTMDELPTLKRHQKCRPLVGYAQAELCRLADRNEETHDARLIRIDLASRPQT